MNVVRLTLTALLCVGFSASRATAQEPLESLPALADDVGRTVELTDTTGHKTTGVLKSVSEAGASLKLPSGAIKSFAEANVKQIDERLPFRPYWIVGGALIGLGCGIVMANFGPPCDYNCVSGKAVVIEAVVLGAGIGIGPDIRRMWRPMYAQPNHATITLSPVISRQRQGVMAAISF